MLLPLDFSDCSLQISMIFHTLYLDWGLPGKWEVHTSGISAVSLVLVKVNCIDKIKIECEIIKI